MASIQCHRLPSRAERQTGGAQAHEALLFEPITEDDPVNRAMPRDQGMNGRPVGMSVNKDRGGVCVEDRANRLFVSHP